MASGGIELNSLLGNGRRYQPVEEEGPGSRADGLVSGGDAAFVPDANSPWSLTHIALLVLLILALAAAIAAAVLGGVFGADNKDLNEDILDCLGELKNTTAGILNNTEIIITDLANLCIKVLMLTDLVNQTSTTIINNTEVLIDGQAEILDCLEEIKNATVNQTGPCLPIVQADIPRIINESGCYQLEESLVWFEGDVAIDVAASNVELRGNNFNITIGGNTTGVRVNGVADVEVHDMFILAARNLQQASSTGVLVQGARHVQLEALYAEGMWHAVDIVDSAAVSMRRVSIFGLDVGAASEVVGVRSLRSSGVALHNSFINITQPEWNSTCVAQVDAPSQGMYVSHTTASCSLVGIVSLGGVGVVVESSYLEVVPSASNASVACLVGSPLARDRTYGSVLRDTTCNANGVTSVALWAINAIGLTVDNCAFNGTQDGGVGASTVRVGAANLGLLDETEEIVHIGGKSTIAAYTPSYGMMVDQYTGTTTVQDSTISGGQLGVFLLSNSSTITSNTIVGAQFWGVLVASQSSTPAGHSVVENNRISGACFDGIFVGNNAYANIVRRNAITGNGGGISDNGVSTIVSDNDVTGNTKSCAFVVRRRSVDGDVESLLQEMRSYDNTGAAAQLQEISHAVRHE